MIIQILLRRLDETKYNEQETIRYLKYLNQIFQIYPEQLTEEMIRNILIVEKFYPHSDEISKELYAIIEIYEHLVL